MKSHRNRTSFSEASPVLSGASSKRDFNWSNYVFFTERKCHKIKYDSHLAQWGEGEAFQEELREGGVGRAQSPRDSQGDQDMSQGGLQPVPCQATVIGATVSPQLTSWCPALT